MSARGGICKENIETARQLLIADTVGYLEDERFAKKAAVRDLIGTLIAARNRGLSFERMAQLLVDAGVEITPGTLRAYFFELKTEKELQDENRRHAEKLAKVRREIGARELAENLQHAQEVALEHVASRSAGRPRFNAFASRAGQSAEMPGPVPPIAATSESTAQRRPQPARQDQSSIAPGDRASAVRRAPAPRAPGPRDQAPPIETALQVVEASNHANIGSSTVQARTIDEIASASVGREVGELVENLHVREGGEVWCESGKPYGGFLKAKQVHLLRTVGRLIAPTVGRSSGDFVAMPRNL